MASADNNAGIGLARAEVSINDENDDVIGISKWKGTHVPQTLQLEDSIMGYQDVQDPMMADADGENPNLRDVAMERIRIMNSRWLASAAEIETKSRSIFLLFNY